MEELIRIEELVKSKIDKGAEVSLKSDNSILMKFYVSDASFADIIEHSIFLNEDIFKGHDYEFSFAYKDNSDYKCIVKTWCDSTEEGMQYLTYNNYEPIERIEESDYFICRRIGKKLSDVKLVNLKEEVVTKLDLF